jgi:hypothetical protein
MLSKRVRPSHNCSSDSEGESYDEPDSFDTDHNTTDLTSFFSALVDHANYSRMSMASKLNVTRLSTMLRVCPSPAAAPRPPLSLSGINFGAKQRLLLAGRAQLCAVLIYRLLPFKGVVAARQLLRLAEIVVSRSLKYRRASSRKKRETSELEVTVHPPENCEFGSIVYHPSGRYAAIGQELWVLKEDGSPASCILPLKCSGVDAFHPSGRYFASGRDVWSLNEDFTAAALVVTLPSPSSDCVILAFHPSGRYLATGEVQENGVTEENKRGAESQSFITKLWALNEDCSAASCVSTLPPQTEYPATQYRLFNCGLSTLHAAFHPSGRYLATGHHKLRMWALKDDCSAATYVPSFGLMGDNNIQSGRMSCEYEHSIYHMAFHPSWLYLVTSTGTSKYKYTNRGSYPSRQLWAVKADCSAAETIYSQNGIQETKDQNGNFAFHPSGNQVAVSVQSQNYAGALHIRQLK